MNNQIQSEQDIEDRAQQEQEIVDKLRQTHATDCADIMYGDNEGIPLDQIIDRLYPRFLKLAELQKQHVEPVILRYLLDYPGHIVARVLDYESNEQYESIEEWIVERQLDVFQQNQLSSDARLIKSHFSSAHDRHGRLIKRDPLRRAVTYTFDIDNPEGVAQLRPFFDRIVTARPINIWWINPHHPKAQVIKDQYLRDTWIIAPKSACSLPVSLIPQSHAQCRILQKLTYRSPVVDPAKANETKQRLIMVAIVVQKTIERISEDFSGTSKVDGLIARLYHHLFNLVRFDNQTFRQSNPADLIEQASESIAQSVKMLFSKADEKQQKTAIAVLQTQTSFFYQEEYEIALGFLVRAVCVFDTLLAEETNGTVNFLQAMMQNDLLVAYR